MKRLIAVAVLLAGCATPGVGAVTRGGYRPGVPIAAQARAEMECHAVTTTDTAKFEACMASKGWPYGPVYFYKHGGTPATFTEDHRVCLTTPVRQAPDGLSPIVGSGTAVWQCMTEVKGWEYRSGRP